MVFVDDGGVQFGRGHHFGSHDFNVDGFARDFDVVLLYLVGGNVLGFGALEVVPVDGHVGLDEGLVILVHHHAHISLFVRFIVPLLQAHIKRLLGVVDEFSRQPNVGGLVGNQCQRAIPKHNEHIHNRALITIDLNTDNVVPYHLSIHR